MVKGAVTRLLGPRRVTSVESTEAGLETLRVELEKGPTPQEIADIERAANGEIGEDAEFIEFEMDRAEAEAHFGKGIYDFHPEGEGGLLRMVRIPDWEASSCRRPHTQSTKEIGALRFERASFDDSKKELELEFRLLG